MITESQRKVLQYIIDYIDSQGNAPSVREIADGVGLKSTSSVHAHIERLESKGYIKRTQGIARGIHIVK